MPSMISDPEVEKTLREIRERVRAESQTLTRVAASSAASRSPNGSATTGEQSIAGTLSRLEANLATIERTWNKLPPLTTYRQGLAARIELWIKRCLKSATHWFTWEQVNYNAAVHHALRDTLAALSTYEQHLKEMQTEWQTKMQAQIALQQQLEAKYVALEARWQAEQQSQAEMAAKTVALQAHLTATIENLFHKQHQQTESLQHEVRERIEHVLDEQRVNFKQLSLETSETAVAFDRTRRSTEARLATIEKALTSAE